jgi:arginase family enzyme
MSRATIFEEHSEVLAHWFGNGVRNATLIYLDAHLDLQFVDPARIARLAACTSAAELARLESPHCLSPDRSACYGIEDFLPFNWVCCGAWYGWRRPMY